MTAKDFAANLATLGRTQLEAMLSAGAEINECNRVLHKVDANVVSEVTKDQEVFYEWDHYPDGDVYDGETHSQYYYHAHRAETGEHGHFHTFLRIDGMPEGVHPVANQTDEEWPKDSDVLSHLIGMSMDNKGLITHLFTTNRWVTGENWFAGDDVIAMLDYYDIDHAWPSWPTNRWITAVVRLFRPQIEKLIRKRDEKVAKWAVDHPNGEVFEDRDLEITSILRVDVDRQIRAVEKALKN